MSTEKELIQRDRSDLEWVTSTEQGRRAMWKLLSYCGIYHDFEGGADQMMKQAGRRQVGLYLLGLISDASEDRIFDMMREAKNRSIEEKEAYDRANTNTSDANRTTDLNDLLGFSDYSEGGVSL